MTSNCARLPSLSLEEAGHETLSAASTTEAEIIIGSEAKFDVLFVDVTLLDDPDAGLEDRYAGLDLALAAASFRPGVRVVYTTGLGLKEGMISLFVEPNVFLAKPYSREQLVSVRGQRFECALAHKSALLATLVRVLPRRPAPWEATETERRASKKVTAIPDAR